MMRSLAILSVLGPALLSCGQRAPEIAFGRSECAHCRMNVVDPRFCSAIVTVKGRQYVFDDAACMVQFVASGAVSEDQVASWWVCDHAHPGALIDAATAFYKHGPAFRSPMRGDAAAFSTPAERDQAHEGMPLSWPQVRKKLLE
ncbi:MAG: nitrous oxide reductase accessory protein NosL [Flavobacteriales bacterium]